MSPDTRWFHDDSVLPGEERTTILPLVLWALVIACVLFLATGCATEEPKSTGPRTEVCLLQILGQTESGVPVVKSTCVTPEEFAKSQQ